MGGAVARCGAPRRAPQLSRPTLFGYPQSPTSPAEPGRAVPGTVSKKMGIKEGTRAILVNVPEAAREAIDPPSLHVASELVGQFDYIHLFARTQAELDDVFPKLKAHLKPTG